MVEVTMEATEVKEYVSGTLQTDGIIRMGSQTNGSSTWYHDVVVVLDLPRSLKKLTVEQKWRGHEAGTTTYEFKGALTQEEGTTVPEEADVTYTFPRTQTATLTFEKKLKKGRWYLWLWRHSKSAPSFMFGARDSYPELSITGETAGAGHVYRGGAWQDAQPKAYKNGAWQDAAPQGYKDGWGELT